MPTLGGALSVSRSGSLLAASWALWLGGCVTHAVLENDVRSAQWRARTLATAADPALAHAALSAQLVELEALYQRDPSDARVTGLLDRGYRLMAHGFIELRYLEALGAGDTGRAEQEAQLRTDAEARARYYRGRLPAGGSVGTPLQVESALVEAQRACDNHDRTAYETRLSALLALGERGPEQRLELVLSRRLAAAQLLPSVAQRCKF